MGRQVTALSAVAMLVAACGTATTSADSTTAPSLSTTTVLVPTTSTTTAPTTTSTTSSTTTTTLPPLQGVRLELVTSELSRPTHVAAPSGDERRFVAERDGRVLIVRPDGSIDPEPFLDIRAEVFDFGIEQGLLGLAFHPDYPADGRFYVYYSDTEDDTRLVEYRVTDDPDVADPGSARLVLFVDQPTNRHNAGHIEFGPDGYLWLSLGEGGAAGTHAQDPNTILSSIVRIDVGVGAGEPYGIPADNPFIDGGAPEVWAYGLRNPWRFSIDAAAGLIYIADVGHERWEEINVVPLDRGGWNFGWLAMEGSACFQRNCDPAGLTLPVLEYSHEEGCSVTGGLVYRGASMPELHGTYFYGDWCSGFIRSFVFRDGAVSDERDWTEELAFDGQPTSFGVDSSGELHITTWSGELYRLVGER